MKPRIHRARLCVWLWLLTILPLAHGANLQTLYSFPAGPAYPYAGLIQGSDGNFYGTTVSGGTHGGYGTVFKVTTNGTLTILVSFDNTDGANPQAGLIQGKDGNFYGTTRNGGSGGYGTVFQVTTNGALTSLYSFTDGAFGGYPLSGLLQGSDGNFYGTTYQGGPFADGYGNYSYGTVFMVTTNGTLTTLASFANTNGANPSAGLVRGSDGGFYGTTVNGGTNGYFDSTGNWVTSGTVFKLGTNGTLTTLASFAGTNGAHPFGGLVQGSDGSFYGTTLSGGAYSDYYQFGFDQFSEGYGTVFMVTTNGTLTTLVSFANTNGANPYVGLVQGVDGNFYGTTVTGGAYSNPRSYINSWMDGYGTVFMVTTNGTLTTLHSFGAVTHAPGVPFDGGNPYGRLIQGNDGNLYGTTYDGGSCDFGAVFMVTTNGTFTSLASVAPYPNGANPYGGLVQDSDGNFYGTTVNGGTNGYHDAWMGTSITFGTVFMMTTNGMLTTLASFSGTNGANPQAGLIQGGGGNFYGTTLSGGSGGFGTVFMVTTNGALTLLYSFTGGDDGANPYGGLLRGSDGNFYGTTVNGGTNGYYGDFGHWVTPGTVFKLTTNGTLTTLASFATTNGAHPYAGLVQGSDGNFYGTTEDGGTNGREGTVFMATSNGVLTSLWSFTGGRDGANPYAGLVQGSDGTFYGTTTWGGLDIIGNYPGYGTVFKMKPDGTFTNIYLFTGFNDGGYIYAGLVQGRDGYLYGAALSGSSASYGTVFQVTTNGTLTTLVSFAKSNGANPYAGLIQGSDGNLYGTTCSGGANADNYDDGYGTVFRIILAPTIFSQPTNQTVVAGGNVTFAVGATGFAPLAYQWRRNGANLAGATNTSLFLSGVTVASTANYSVVVSNPGGTVVSSNATLTVVCPTITISPVTLPVAILGQAYSQTNTASGGRAPYTFARISGGLPPGLALSSSGVLSGTPTNTGNYTFAVRATDSYGCTGTNRYTLAVGIFLVNPSMESNGCFRAQVVGLTGTTFVVLTSSNAAQPLSNWTSLTTNSAPSGIFDFTDTNSIAFTNNWPQRFYRVRLSP